MSQLARDTRLGRESLYKPLSAEGNPEFATLLKVVRALGIRLIAQPARIHVKKARAKKRKAGAAGRLAA